jgi:hypothetical protein
MFSSFFLVTSDLSRSYKITGFYYLVHDLLLGSNLKLKDQRLLLISDVAKKS